MTTQADHWLTKDRLKIYPRIFLFIYAVAICYWLFMASGNFDMRGHPLGTDFTSFYAASSLVLQGNPHLAYDFSSHFAAEKAAVGEQLNLYYSFSYPPTFLLLLAPFAKLPYLLALALWLSMTLLFFIAMVRKLANEKETIILLLAFPAVFLTIGHGQNAFLSAGLIAGGLYYLDRKPLLAGLLIGLLSFKPHLGILIPFVLILSGHWKVFISAAITTLLFASVSWLAFGDETWNAFFESTVNTQNTLNNGIVGLYKMQSLFASLRNNGVGLTGAYLLHGGLALCASAAIVWVWLQDVDKHMKYAALCTASLLISPFLLDYDLTILAIPIACLVRYGISNGFRPHLLNILCLAWVAPLIVRILNLYINIPWMPILLSTLLYQIVMVCRKKLPEQKEIND